MMKQQAKSFAEKAHKGQRRKNANIPYITHPIRVAERLESIHASDELICAAYLHDVVEDTPYEIEDIEQQFEPEWIHVERDLAIIAIVGEGMRDTIGIANKATAAFADSNISLRMINQGASEISMFFAIPSIDLKKALNNLYQNYFEK